MLRTRCHSGTIRLSVPAWINRIKLVIGLILVPDAKKAYLIINANVIPSDERQPTGIAIKQLALYRRLSTTKDIFEVRPYYSRVGRLVFKHGPDLVLGGRGHWPNSRRKRGLSALQ